MEIIKNMKGKVERIYSDLVDEQINADTALNFGSLTKKGKYDLEKFEFDIDTPELARKIGKAEGHYTTLNCSKILPHLTEVQDYVSEQIAQSLKTFFARITGKKSPKIMVVGLGNRGMVADSLGVAVTDRLISTTQIPKELCVKLGKLCFLNTGVGGITGIPSFYVVQGVVSIVKPDILIAIDALVAHNPARLGCSFQISDSGLTPGAGVKNYLQTLNRENLGCGVVAVGVPMMISGAGLCRSVQKELADKIFAPKEVDLYIDKCSRTIAHAINLAVHGRNYRNYC